MGHSTLDLNPAMSMSQLWRTIQMRERVVEACRLVESRRSVRGVHIVARGQPTSDELQQYRAYAVSCHVALTVDSHGMISIRPGTGEGA